MIDALATASPELRKGFLRHRFGFECDCARCRGERCNADGEPVEGAARSADAALESLAEGCGPAEALAAREAHRALVVAESDEQRRLVGLPLREHASLAAAVDAALPFVSLEHTLANTHWMRHQVRSQRLLCLLALPNKAVPAFLLVAEHLAAEMVLLPRTHLARLPTYAKFRQALGGVPPALRPKLVARVKAEFGALDLRACETAAGWLKATPEGEVARRG